MALPAAQERVAQCCAVRLAAAVAAGKCLGRRHRPARHVPCRRWRPCRAIQRAARRRVCASHRRWRAAGDAAGVLLKVQGCLWRVQQSCWLPPSALVAIHRVRASACRVTMGFQQQCWALAAKWRAQCSASEGWHCMCAGNHMRQHCCVGHHRELPAAGHRGRRDAHPQAAAGAPRAFFPPTPCASASPAARERSACSHTDSACQQRGLQACCWPQFSVHGVAVAPAELRQRLYARITSVLS